MPEPHSHHHHEPPDHGNHHHFESLTASDGDALAGSPASATSRFPSGQKYNLEGLDCGHCVETVEKAVAAVPGVESASVDLVPDGVSRLTVSGTASESALRDAVTAAGYGFSR
jgi:copper chaperone CopZ